MRLIMRVLIIILFSLALSAPVLAATNLLSLMMTSMIDAFADSKLAKGNNQLPLGSYGMMPNTMMMPGAIPSLPYQGMSYPGMNPWSMNQKPGFMGQYPSPAAGANVRNNILDPRVLDGIWVAQNGSVMMMQRGFSRLYFSRGVYQDQQFQLSGQSISFRDVDSGAVKIYRYQYRDGQLTLVSEQGKQLQFVRRKASKQQFGSNYQ